MKFAIKTKRGLDCWLGADDLARHSAATRESCLGAYMSKAKRVYFHEREIAHEVCRHMNGTRFRGSFVVVRVGK